MINLKREKIRRIIEPTKKKLLSTLGLFIIASAAFSFAYSLINTFFSGWLAPLPIYLEQTTTGIGEKLFPGTEEKRFFPILAMANILIWYLISSIILFVRGENK